MNYKYIKPFSYDKRYNVVDLLSSYSIYDYYEFRRIFINELDNEDVLIEYITHKDDKGDCFKSSFLACDLKTFTICWNKYLKLKSFM